MLNNSSVIISYQPSVITVTGSLLAIVTVLGSLLIMLTYHSEPKIQSLTNLWIVSMSFTDLLLGVLVMPISVVAGGYSEWIFGQLFCDIFIMLDVLCCTCSIYHLCLISFDRYLCITRPLSYPQKRTRKSTFIAIALCWCFCLVLSLPPLMGWSEKRKPGECEISSWSYAVFSSILSFYLPLILIIFCYMAMYRTTKKQNKKHKKLAIKVAMISRRVSRHLSRMSIRRPVRSAEMELKVQKLDLPIRSIHLQVDGCDSPSPNSPTTSLRSDRLRPTSPNELDNITIMGETPRPTRKHPGFHSAVRLMETTTYIRKISSAVASNSQAFTRKMSRKTKMSTKSNMIRNRERQEKKAGRVVAVVIITFISFWAPFFILNVVGDICACVPGAVFQVATWMGYANSAMNPMIYSLFNLQFRNAMVKVIKCQKWDKIRHSITCKS